MNAVASLPPARAGIVTAKDGRRVVVRPIWQGDARALRRLHGRLSPDTIYRRFMTSCPRGPSPATLRYLTVLDHDTREALVAVHRHEIVAVARYHVVRRGEAELAVLVEDAWQRQGLARALILRLKAAAQARGIAAFSGSILGDNRPAVELMKALFPAVRIRIVQGEIEFHIALDHVPEVVRVAALG